MNRPLKVNATLNYFKPNGPSPKMFWRQPRPDEDATEPEWEVREVTISDMRGDRDSYSLEYDGFAAVDFDISPPPMDNLQAMERHYFPAVIACVKKYCGADKVIAFDHNFRSANAKYNTVTDKPAHHVHNDYTDKSAATRIRDLIAFEEANLRLKKRYMYINHWRPIHHPAEDLPLTVCAGSSVEKKDLVLCKMYWPDRIGETYVLQHNPNHQWFYLSGMTPKEAFLLKCYDSDPNASTRFAPHSAFENPAAAPGSKPRESLEVRTIAFFD